MKAKSKMALSLFLVVIGITCFGLYFSLPPPVQYEGWLVRQYDEVQYSVERDINAGNTFVTEFLSQYGIESTSVFRIRVAETPPPINITSIAEAIFTFTGILSVERQVGQEWIPLESSLPFFLPVGYWSEIETSLNEFAPLTLKEEWWGEMSLTGSVSAEPGLDYFIAWEIRDGVLQGLTFNVSSSNSWDFVRLALSSQKLAYETDLDYLMQTISTNSGRVLLMFGFLGPPFIIPLMWNREIGARILQPLPGSIEDQLEEYGRSYLFLWSLGLLITVIAGLYGSLFLSESILPMLSSYGLAILLATCVVYYRIRHIEWDQKPVEIVQYAVVSVASSVTGLFLVEPGEVSSPIAYVLPLVMIVGASLLLFLLHPLRSIRSKKLAESAEIAERNREG